MVTGSLLAALPIWVALAYLLASYRLFGPLGNLALMLVLGLLVWIPFELFFVYRLRSKYELQLRSKGKGKFAYKD